MVGHFHNYKAFLHTFNFRMGTVITSKSFFESTGVGSALANYLLSEFASRDMDYNFGQALSVYVVDKVIKNVGYCDRPIRVALLFSHPSELLVQAPEKAFKHLSPAMQTVRILDMAEVKAIEDKVTQIDEETKQHRIEKLRSALLSYSATFAKYGTGPIGLSDSDAQS
jgi:hypothetical protein